VEGLRDMPSDCNFNSSYVSIGGNMNIYIVYYHEQSPITLRLDTTVRALCDSKDTAQRYIDNFAYAGVPPERFEIVKQEILGDDYV
jgi:hypothetical protein